jgi:hypothetical protein
MEILWKSYGVPLEHHADNTGSTGYQEAFIRLSGSLRVRARPVVCLHTIGFPALLRGFHPGLINLRLTWVARMLVCLQHGFQAVA